MIISRHAVGIVGETKIDKIGRKLKLIEYNNSKDIVVEFEDGYKTKSSYKEFKNGVVKSPYDRTVFGVGYLGEGKYKAYEDNKITEPYNVWRGVIRRCCSESFKIERPTYKDCEICEEWHNFQTFGKWFDENYYQIENEDIQLDKDILHKGNKLYSPDNCVFVPSRINSLFIKNDANRGNYPIGVTFKKSTGRYTSYYNKVINGEYKRIHLGYFSNPTEAFYIYKNAKEKYIKEMAEEYKDRIPQKLYEAMYKYEVEITD